MQEAEKEPERARTLLRMQSVYTKVCAVKTYGPTGAASPPLRHRLEHGLPLPDVQINKDSSSDEVVTSVLEYVLGEMKDELVQDLADYMTPVWTSR